MPMDDDGGVPATPEKPAKEPKASKPKASKPAARKPPKKAPGKASPRMEAKGKAPKKAKAPAKKTAKPVKVAKAPKRKEWMGVGRMKKPAAKPKAKRVAKPVRRAKAPAAQGRAQVPIIKKVILSADHQALKEMQQVLRTGFLEADKEFKRMVAKQEEATQLRAQDLVNSFGLTPRGAGILAIRLALSEQKLKAFEESGYELVEEGGAQAEQPEETEEDYNPIPPPRNGASQVSPSGV